MTCTTCKDGYALDSTTSCTKCPTNCETCTASGTLLCSECKDGYALAGDKLSCIACATAAFDNCAECGDVNATTEVAECEECSNGYTLEDEEEDLSCVSTSSLVCNGGDGVDHGPECSACATGFTLTDDFECAIMCYSCGDIESSTYVAQSMCQIPTSGMNSTSGFATLEECTEGACYAAYKGGEVMAGCIPSSFNGGMCSSTYMEEVCATASSTTKCEQCCTTDSCNTFVTTMDGLSDSASFVVFNALLMVVCAVFSFRL